MYQNCILQEHRHSKAFAISLHFLTELGQLQQRQQPMFFFDTQKHFNLSALQLSTQQSLKLSHFAPRLSLLRRPKKAKQLVKTNKPRSNFSAPTCQYSNGSPRGLPELLPGSLLNFHPGKIRSARPPYPAENVSSLAFLPLAWGNCTSLVSY